MYSFTKKLLFVSQNLHRSPKLATNLSCTAISTFPPEESLPCFPNDRAKDITKDATFRVWKRNKIHQVEVNGSIVLARFFETREKREKGVENEGTPEERVSSKREEKEEKKIRSKDKERERERERERLKRAVSWRERGGKSEASLHYFISKAERCRTMGHPRKVDMTESRRISRSFRVSRAENETGRTGDVGQKRLRFVKKKKKKKKKKRKYRHFAFSVFLLCLLAAVDLLNESEVNCFR